MKPICKYYCDCVSWPRRYVADLTSMIDSAMDITRRQFMKNTHTDDLRELEDALGYGSHYTMAGDYHVSYHRGVLSGKRVYFFKQSAIEYVFTKDGAGPC